MSDMEQNNKYTWLFDNKTTFYKSIFLEKHWQFAEPYIFVSHYVSFEGTSLFSHMYEDDFKMHHSTL